MRLMGFDIRTIIILIALIILMGCNRNGPLLVDVSIDKISNIQDKEIPELLKQSNVAGLSIVVIREKGLVIARFFWYANVEMGRNIDEHTIFPAASLGKPIFAYIVVSLAQQGKIDLDITLYSYLKEEVVKGNPRSQIITARMVLNHTTALPNLDGKKSKIEFLFSPGVDFKYSGHAYLHLQKVIEKITKKHLNELANELVFQPLKMTEISFIWQKKYEQILSANYDSSGESFPKKRARCRAFLPGDYLRQQKTMSGL